MFISSIENVRVDIMLSHHLQLKVQCNFTYALKAFLVAKLIAIII